MEYCCRIWAEASQSSLLPWLRVERVTFYSAVSFPQIQSWKLLNHCFHSKCSDKLHFLVPPVQNFATRTRHAIFTEPNHPHFLYVLNLRWKFQLVFFPLRMAIIWNKLPYPLTASLNPSFLTLSFLTSSFFIPSFLNPSFLNPSFLTPTSSQETVVIFSPCPHNLHFLPTPPFSHITYH